MYLKHADLSKYEVIDIEASDLLLGVTRIWCLVSINAATGAVNKFVGHEEIRRWASELPSDVILVGHNIVSYDVPALNRVIGLNISLDRCVDTLVLSYLYHPKMFGGHSLEAWGERFKFPKGSYNDWSKFTPEMLEYCVQDVRLTVRLFTALTDRMRRRGFSELSCRIEHQIRAVVDKQERAGFYFDVPAAQRLYDHLRGVEANLSQSVRTLFPPQLKAVKTYEYRTKADGTPYSSYDRHVDQYPELRFNGDGTYTVFDWQTFNLGSPSQRVERLLSLGWVPQVFTKKTKKGGGGNPQVDEDSLVAFAEESGEKAVQALADWVVTNGRGNMVNTWIEAVWDDSHIHGSVLTCGAASRRMRHFKPATATIPGNKAKYGRECRELWTVQNRDTHDLVGVDAKSIQMRCFADVLPDPSAGRRYYDEEFCPDPHQENAEIIGIERGPAKNVFYANLFGAYPPKLASTAKLSSDKGVWIQNQMYEVTPGLKEATERAKAEFRANDGFLRCPDGGFVRCENESAALNYKIQPAEACVMKLAGIMLDKLIIEKGWDTHLRGSIHDEWQFSCPTGLSKEFGPAAANCIRDAGEELKFRVPMAGDFKIGKTWAETH
jgi:DNA polymerase-1